VTLASPPAGAAAVPGGRAAPPRRRRPQPAAWVLGGLAAANAAAVVGLWWRAGESGQLGGLADGLSAAGRLCGLLGAYLVLVQLLLLARIPALERRAGFDRLARWHRRNGKAALGLLLAHAALVLAGYAVREGVAPWTELARLVTGYPGVITAVAGLTLLCGVVATSVVIARRRLRYQTWYFVHLYAYLGVALAFSHQLATGRDFVGDPAARAYWYALYAVTLAALLTFRLLAPLAGAARHRMRVRRVIPEAPGVWSIEIAGRGLERLGARSGQFFCWRFLTRRHWWEAHPFSLSAAPAPDHLRITVKGLGDFTAALGELRTGTRVLAEGPYGAFTSGARRHPRAALIGGGVGITPIRALLEDMPGEHGAISVVYRVAHEREVIFREELDVLAARRGAQVHYVVGGHAAPDGGALLSPAHLLELVPDLPERDVYVCGPPAMTDAVRRALKAAGVPRRQVIAESFAY
jgi:predicted ferric reductase